MPPAWIYTFPTFSEAIVKATEANGEVQIPTPNLLSFDAPSKMTEWIITAINLLVATAAEASVKEVGKAFTQRLTVQLLIGGDVVWESSSEVTGLQIEVAGKGFMFAQHRVSGDLNQPIPLPSGRALQLRFIVATNLATALTRATINESAATTSFTGNTSTFAYGVHALTGHRRLS